ncbi:5307_t:CDS:2, partial [Paraglomus occultum]
SLLIVEAAAILPAFMQNTNNLDKAADKITETMIKAEAIAAYVKKAKNVSNAYTFLADKYKSNTEFMEKLDSKKKELEEDSVKALKSLNYTDRVIDELFNGESTQYLGEGWQNQFVDASSAMTDIQYQSSL